MKLGSAHLSYCTNVHPGETWAELHETLTVQVPAVRRELGTTEPMGLGLWVSARALEELDEAAFATALTENDIYLFSLNGFPFGRFRGMGVKTSVYEPDWSDKRRIWYTLDLARLLVDHAPPDLATLSISTLPGCFRPHAQPERREAIARNLLETAGELWATEALSGRRIVLALEPEPSCMLETTSEMVAFFEEELLTNEHLVHFAASTGLDRAGAEGAIRRHLGLCLDVCHAAVEFEDLDNSIDHVIASGIEIAKIQLSNAIDVAADGDTVALLRPFAEDGFLHQVVVQRAGGSLCRFVDLSEALERGVQAGDERWRVHVHIPLWADPAPPLGTTRGALNAVLHRHATSPLTEHLEVETYGFDVLPATLRDRPTARAIADELRFVQNVLRP